MLKSINFQKPRCSYLTLAIIYPQIDYILPSSDSRVIGLTCDVIAALLHVAAAAAAGFGKL